MTPLLGHRGKTGSGLAINMFTITGLESAARRLRARNSQVIHRGKGMQTVVLPLLPAILAVLVLCCGWTRPCVRSAIEIKNGSHRLPVVLFQALRVTEVLPDRIRLAYAVWARLALRSWRSLHQRRFFLKHG